MIASRFRLACLCAATALTLTVSAGPTFAQGPGMMGPGNWGSGFMMGPGPMMSPFGRGARGFAAMCDPRFAGFAAWRFDRIEGVVRPTDEQRKALDDLRTASTKAAETMQAACPKETPATVPARAEFMEKRTEAMLAAIKTVRPALDAFYATLTDQQKARINSYGPRGGGWGGWRNWMRRGS